MKSNCKRYTVYSCHCMYTVVTACIQLSLHVYSCHCSQMLWTRDREGTTLQRPNCKRYTLYSCHWVSTLWTRDRKGTTLQCPLLQRITQEQARNSYTLTPRTSCSSCLFTLDTCMTSLPSSLQSLTFQEVMQVLMQWTVNENSGQKLGCYKQATPSTVCKCCSINTLLPWSVHQTQCGG